MHVSVCSCLDLCCEIHMHCQIKDVFFIPERIKGIVLPEITNHIDYKNQIVCNVISGTRNVCSKYGCEHERLGESFMDHVFQVTCWSQMSLSYEWIITGDDEKG